jgi:hypothetical protein
MSIAEAPLCSTAAVRVEGIVVDLRRTVSNASWSIRIAGIADGRRDDHGRVSWLKMIPTSRRLAAISSDQLIDGAVDLAWQWARFDPFRQQLRF